MRASRAAMVLAAALLSPVASRASFEDTGAGSRAAGLGGAFAAIANDVHTLHYNPAGLVFLRRKEFSATHSLLHPGLSDGSRIGSSLIAYGQPLSFAAGTLGFGWRELDGADLVSERTLTLGYGRRISQKWALGFNFKQLYRHFNAPSGTTSDSGRVSPGRLAPAFASGSSKWNIGLDLGALYRPFRNYSYGFAIQDLNEPDLSITSDSRDPVPMLVRASMAYSDEPVVLAAALDLRRAPGGRGRDIFLAAAAEKWWLGSGFALADLAARGGLSLGSRSFSQMTLGFSYRLNSVQLDYAFLMPLRGIGFGSSEGNHHITFTARFGKVIVEPDYEIRMRSAEISLKKTEKKLELEKKEAERIRREFDDYREEEARRLQERSSRAEAQNRREAAGRYGRLMERYWQAKSNGAALKERIGMLAGILKEFRPLGLDVSAAEAEYAVAISDRAKADADLSVTWTYYQKIAARGASLPERLEHLGRMMERFSRSGADLATVESELRALRER